MELDTREKIVLHFTEDDVFNNTKWFKSHREFVEAKFLQLGFKVTKWNWYRDFMGRWIQDKDGIVFKKDDSVLELSIEITGIVGLNLERTNNAKRVLVQDRKSTRLN